MSGSSSMMKAFSTPGTSSGVATDSCILFQEDDGHGSTECKCFKKWKALKNSFDLLVSNKLDKKKSKILCLYKDDQTTKCSPITVLNWKQWIEFRMHDKN